MSQDEKNFLQQLKLLFLAIVIPLVISSAGVLVVDHFKNKEFWKTVKGNVESIKTIKTYFLKTEDFFKYTDNQKELIKANRDNDLDRIKRLEEEQKEITKYLRNTRGSKSKTDK